MHEIKRDGITSLHGIHEMQLTAHMHEYFESEFFDFHLCFRYFEFDRN